MSKETNSVVLAVLTALAAASSTASQTNLAAQANGVRPPPAQAVAESDRVKDGLVGPVRRVRTEVVKLANGDGRLVEGKRALLEIAAYDLKGNKIENQYFPLAGATLTGKEVYKYDDKGNISEMTLFNGDGAVLGKEVYKYEFDFAGNWHRMITSVAVIESGKVTLEPTEVTYRFIMYFLDAKMAKMVQPASQPATGGSASLASVSTALNGPATTLLQPPAVPSSVRETKRNKSADVNRNSPLPLPPSTAVANKLSLARPVEEKTAYTGANVAQGPLVVLDSEPPPILERKPLLKPISRGVLNGAALSLPVPQYPDSAKRMRQSGIVSVDVIIDEKGKVISAQATTGPTVLRETAVQAALKARFSATRLSGQPVKVLGVINYKFMLK
jgi:TonB family protein